MSGVTVPEFIIVEPFGADAAESPTPDADVTLPIPIDSQIGTLPGAASFATGFPPATRADPETEGGVPPYGQDMNGILYMLSAYCALLQAGQRVNWNEDASDFFEGYAVGAELASSATPGRVWYNILDGNTNEPDVSDEGWVASDPQAADESLSGAQNNVPLPGASDFAIDIDTTAGPCDISGFVAERNGQKIFITNVGANLLTILAESGLSTAANRIRSATDLALVQNQTLTLQWFSGIQRWLLV